MDVNCLDGVYRLSHVHVKRTTFLLYAYDSGLCVHKTMHRAAARVGEWPLYHKWPQGAAIA